MMRGSEGPQSVRRFSLPSLAARAHFVVWPRSPVLPAGRRAIDAWVPRHLQRQISAIRDKYPQGFQRIGDASDTHAAEADFETAELHYRRYIIKRRAKLKLRSTMMMIRLQAIMDESMAC